MAVSLQLLATDGDNHMCFKWALTHERLVSMSVFLACPPSVIYEQTMCMIDARAGRTPDSCIYIYIYIYIYVYIHIYTYTHNLQASFLLTGVMLVAQSAAKRAPSRQWYSMRKQPVSVRAGLVLVGQ